MSVLLSNRIVRVLLEQVVSSTIERCVDPQLMEQSVSVPPKVYQDLFVVMCVCRWWRSSVNGTRITRIQTHSDTISEISVCKF